MKDINERHCENFSWGTNRDWGVYMNKLQFLSKFEN